MGVTSKQGEDSFVLTYESFEDPSVEERESVLARLRPLDAREVVPGTIKVVGPRKEVERATRPLSHWKLAQEKLFSIRSPAKSALSRN